MEGPAWIECNLPLGPIYDEHCLEELDSFEKRGLLSPGTYLQFATGKLALVGDMLENQSTSYGCPEYDQGLIVRRYCKIDLPPPPITEGAQSNAK